MCPVMMKLKRQLSRLAYLSNNASMVIRTPYHWYTRHFIFMNAPSPPDTSGPQKNDMKMPAFSHALRK